MYKMISTILTSMKLFIYSKIDEKVSSKSEKTVVIVVKLTGVETMNYSFLD